MNIVLCGHTGSFNRGCDAIVKSTADLLSHEGTKCVLASYNKEEDERFGIEEFYQVIRYVDMRTRPIRRCVSGLLMKIDKKFLSAEIRQKSVVNYMKKNNSASLSVGGDVYCYKGLPFQFIQMNKSCYENHIPSILWACSIEKEKLEIPEILHDIDRYSLIFPREIESYNYLLNAGISKDKIIKMCDPAFTLKSEKINIDWMDSSRKWIGINISPIAYGKNKDKNLVKENFRSLIKFIIEKTKFNIVLIPHVYQTEDSSVVDDLSLHKDIIDSFGDSKAYLARIKCIDEFYNAKQLKYIISHCYILVASRTHASIAGYSSCVPTFVIGYSVKAEGIAIDLFGESNNFVLMSKDIAGVNEITEKFCWILNNYETIRKRLVDYIPEYIGQANRAARTLVDFLENYKKVTK